MKKSDELAVFSELKEFGVSIESVESVFWNFSSRAPHDFAAQALI